MKLIHLFRSPGLPESQRRSLVALVRARIMPNLLDIRTEYCFNIDAGGSLTSTEFGILKWLLAETFEPDLFGTESFLETGSHALLEVGPRMSFSTAWSTNAVSVCRACGLTKMRRIERSRRFQLINDKPATDAEIESFTSMVHDRMTECPYPEPLESFEHGLVPEPVREVPVLDEGQRALERLDREMGLAFDDWDLEYYTGLFRDKVKRNPTTVECFDIAQSNSEHSRHWFFRGRLVVDGEEQPAALLDMVQEPLENNPNNSVIAFRDNSSSIRGALVDSLAPADATTASGYRRVTRDLDLTLTAETHNFPSGVAPFPGAETGTGGRIRDGHATGRASLVVAGTAAYCVGNLRIPGYQLPWEDPGFGYPENLASPLDIEIEASNGASDYGNKFGEPVIAGYTRSFGLRLPGGERREWIKPIMFSGGIGQMEHDHAEKHDAESGMLIVKIGGPAYRIGMGGGAASSMVQGENAAELDFNAVQRGDAEMEQKVNRVIRACSELGPDNPIVSIHDQGAGGNCNVLKELVEKTGGLIEIRDVPIGDASLSVLEIWGAEYQENDALLLRPEHAELFGSLCAREKAPWAVVGTVTDSGRIVVHDAEDDSTPVDMDLEDVLGDMPRKTFELERKTQKLEAFHLPVNTTVHEALDRVLRLLSVGSKRFLTTKVDRAVTGLVARQQCAGPLHLTVADVAVIAQSHFGITGGATAIGEQPIKGLIDAAAMARMSVGEALTNLVWAQISNLEDVRCSANWMWAAKLPGEGAAMYDAMAAMKDMMIDLGIAVDGGKDSLSMAALAPVPGSDEQETVKAPGALVISAYAPCTDIRRTVTPDLELPGDGRLLYVDLGGGRYRLGGSALAQVFGQLGDQSPDVDDKSRLAAAFVTVQDLISRNLVTAGHDRSDGGLITTLLEMAFAGNCGIDVTLPTVPGIDTMAQLFAEELGLVLEVAECNADEVVGAFTSAGVGCIPVGRTLTEARILIRHAGSTIIDENMPRLRDVWEATSFSIDRLQADPEKVSEEQHGLAKRRTPPLALSFMPRETETAVLDNPDRPRVAVLREEGSNSDREMAAAFHMAGFEPWDLTMTDLLEGRASLADFRGLAAVGGFSYADVLDSAKGWAGSIRFNDKLRRQFADFNDRSNTFSLGVCNGCQLLALLGLVPWRGIDDNAQPRFVNNASGRFESRFATVRILESPSIFLQGMENSVLGIWLQHGEGRAYFPEPGTLDEVLEKNLAPVRYVDDAGQPTEGYPFNPNGSPEGIAALCSADGRRLAVMPHPERSFLPWQLAWQPREWRGNTTSPWLRLFQNARTWCD